MAYHASISVATKSPFISATLPHPYDNTNGLLRQYVPKSTDLSGYHADYLRFVANEMNERLRKRLDWRTPTEALQALLSNPTDPTGVAPTG
jgi:IS30 family transposase